MSSQGRTGSRLAAPLASSGRSFYIGSEPDRVFATLHAPAGESRRIGVLVCPAFGWDELCVHRSMRVWADLCARDGYPALRFDLPSAGDSAGSPRDPGRLDAWTAAVTAASHVLRDAGGADRVVALGIGLGGLIASRAIAFGAPIDDLIMWSVPPRGSLLLREMRAFAAIAASAAGGAAEPLAATPPEPDDGSLSIAGFAISAETIADLGELDVTALPLHEAGRRRVLLLGRDAVPPDPRLAGHFERAGAEVSVAEGVGFGAMMADPQLSEIPYDTLARMLEWLEGTPGPAARLAHPPDVVPVPVAAFAQLRHDGAVIRESGFEFMHQGRRMSGVLAEPVSTPVAGVCAVLLNAGAVRRVGAHRMWVESARRWAARGVPTLRFDMAGMGDSDGEERGYHLNVEFHRDGFSEQVRSALDALEAAGMPGRFVLCGVCSGAYWSFHAALADERVRAVMLVNLLAFFWSDALGVARDARRTRALLREGAVGEIVRIVAADRWRIGRLLRTTLRRAIRAFGRGATEPGFDVPIVAALDGLRDRRVDMLVLLGNGEPLYDDLVAEHLIERLDRWPNLRFERIDVDDHVFRPLWAQRLLADTLADTLTTLLDAELESAPDGEKRRFGARH
jgi:dienelactone hydrolase